jgi:hypothetical protein
MRFDISRLKGKLGKMRDWIESHHITYKIIFSLMGIVSTIWFLVRVIPKPSRAAYPCMQVADPFMSGFVTYLLAFAGLTIISRRFGWKLINVRLGASINLLLGVVWVWNPDNSGKPIPVLGVHEHWNNPVDKQYSRNLRTGNGIELVSIPEDLVKSVKKRN